MQLDLEGGVEGEVAVVVAAAPLAAVTAVVHVHVQGDRLLLRDGGGCRGGNGKTGGKENEKERWRGGGRREKRCRRRSRGMKDDWRPDGGGARL